MLVERISRSSGREFTETQTDLFAFVLKDARAVANDLVEAREVAEAGHGNAAPAASARDEVHMSRDSIAAMEAALAAAQRFVTVFKQKAGME